MVTVQRIRDRRMLTTEYSSVSHSLLPRLRNHHRRGSIKIVRPRGTRWTWGISVFWTRHGTGTHELTVVVTAYTRPPQAASRKTPSMEEGRWESSLTPSKELLRINSFWQQESQFSLRVEPLVGWSCFSEGHTSKSIWAAQIEFDGFEIK